MPSHPVEDVIAAADKAIVSEDFDALMALYADDAVLVVQPGVYARGKEQIRTAFLRIADYFGHSLKVRQDGMLVLEGGDTALVLRRTLVEHAKGGTPATIARAATYVFRKSANGAWLCVIDNSYGTDLLESA